MNKKFFLFSLLVFFIFPLNENVLGDHGSGGGGGGCSGDCTPPTLGQDNSGINYVKEGFSINGNAFEVTHFKQEIQTQTIKTGESVEIILKIYENSGTKYLSHVGLSLGLEEKTLGGVKVHSHQTQIIWEQDSDGTVSTDVKDPNNLISNVDVKNELTRDAFGNEEGLNQISFKFNPIKSFDANTIVVKTWDYKRNTWTNTFHNSLIIEKAEPSNDDFSQKLHDPLIPNWVKTNAGFWAENQIDDETFSNGIKFLIKEKIMEIPNLKEFEPQPKLHFIEAEKGPQHYIERYYNDEFYREWFDGNYPEYTIEEAVGYTPSLVIPDWVKSNAKLWTNDQISDKEFVAGIAFLIENGIILL